MNTVIRKIGVTLLAFCLASFTSPGPAPRIFLIGDSTMANKRPEESPETGWGMAFQAYINAEVLNYAVNGRSTKSFRTSGDWNKVYAQLKPTDWVFIQFGHNDSKEADTSRYAAAHTDYKKNLVRYITEIRAKGATPVLITPVVRRKFNDQGNFSDSHGDYPGVVKEVGTQLNVPVLDLHTKSRAAVIQHGAEGSKYLFLQLKKNTSKNYPDGKEDNTHFSPYGAKVMAALVAAEIHNLKLSLSSSLLALPFRDKYVYELPVIRDISFPKDTFNILNYNAKADGITVNSKPINDAIAACNASGGGTVLVPKGFWLTGPIVLKSNVNLHLTNGAVLQFSNNTNDYALVKTNWEGLDAIRAQSPLSASDVENIAITGEGIMDGAGDAWRAIKNSKMTPPEWSQLIGSGKGVLNEKADTWYPTARALKGSMATRAGVIAEGYDFQKAEEIKEFLRPNMVSLTRCSGVLLEGVTVQNSPAWCLHPLLCQHLTLRNVTVRNPWNAQNGDGVDIESCSHVRVENSTFDVGDDAICIKSGRDEEGRKRGVPTENVIVSGCTVFHGHGGFVVGSEMSGGARNLFVSDCNFLGTDVGLRFKTTRGRGGIVEKAYIYDINMGNIGGAAILFDMYYMAKDPLADQGKPVVVFQPITEATPQFRDFHINHVVCKGAETAIFVRGLPEMNIKNIEMENIFIQSKTGLVYAEGDSISLKNATLFCDDKIVMNVQDSKYITFDNIQYRPSEVLLKVSGDRSKEIKLLNTTGSSAKKEIELGTGVSEKIIKRK